MKIIFTPSVKLFSSVHISALIFFFIFGYEGYLHYLFITIGYLLQTYFEFASHYYLFHGPLWKFHKYHHLEPSNEIHLFVPFAYSIPLGLTVNSCYYCFLPLRTSFSFMTGHTMSYLFFEYIHYISHRRPKYLVHILKIPFIKELILAHKKHHYKNGKLLKDKDGDFKNYGFTTLYWDKVYETYE